MPDILLEVLVNKSWLLALLLVIGAALLNGGILFAFQISFQRLMDAHSKRAEKRENYIAEIRLKFLDELQELYKAIMEFFDMQKDSFAPSADSGALNELDLYRKLIDANRTRYEKLTKSEGVYKKVEKQAGEIQKFYKLNESILGAFSKSYQDFWEQWENTSSAWNILSVKRFGFHDDRSMLLSLSECEELSNQYDDLFESYNQFESGLSFVQLPLIGLINNVREHIYSR